VETTPAADNAVVSGDYGQFGTTDFGRSAKQDDLTDSAYNDVTLNSSGLSHISLTALTKLGIRYGWDFDSTITGLTWTSAKFQRIHVRMADVAQTTKDPRLAITHSSAAAVAVSPSGLLLMGAG